MNRTLIVYSSKYGSTKEIAWKLARVLGPASIITPSEFCAQHREFESVVIGSPIYREQVLPEISDFVANHFEWLRTKPVGLFASALVSSPAYLREFEELLGHSVVWTGFFGGKIDESSLDAKDLASIRRFLTMVTVPSLDSMDDRALAEQAIALKRALKNARSMPEAELRSHIMKFLLSHNTCTLCTGHDNEVRATPIEYSCKDGALYLLSEGGEKFAHLLLNPRVSVAVYDAYSGFSRLCGLQISGVAQIVPAQCEEYYEALLLKGLNREQLKKLPVTLHVIRIDLETCEFLCSDLAKDGCEIKQTILFS